MCSTLTLARGSTKIKSVVFNHNNLILPCAYYMALIVINTKLIHSNKILLHYVDSYFTRSIKLKISRSNKILANIFNLISLFVIYFLLSVITGTKSSRKEINNMTKKDNTINIHQSYTLFQLFVITRNTLSTIMNEIQKYTPYDYEYKKAYQYYSSQVSKTLNQFEKLCRKCQDKQESEVK